jgi:hypothetical protein
LLKRKNLVALKIQIPNTGQQVANRWSNGGYTIPEG